MPQSIDKPLSYAYHHKLTIIKLRQALRNNYEIVNIGHVYQIIYPNGMRYTLNGVSENIIKKMRKEVARYVQNHNNETERDNRCIETTP